MSKHDTDTSINTPRNAAGLMPTKRGITKHGQSPGTDDRHWRRDWHRLVLGAGARLQMAGPALALVYLIVACFRFLFCVHWVSWCYTALQWQFCLLCP